MYLKFVVARLSTMSVERRRQDLGFRLIWTGPATNFSGAASVSIMTAPHQSGPYYYGWNIVALTLLSQLVGFGVVINCISLYIPYWAADLHAPVSALAFCYSAPAVIAALLGPVAGYLADRFSVRWMITLGLAGAGAAFALVSRVTALWQLLAIFATIVPIAMVISGYIPCQALVARWFERRRGMAIGVCALGLSLAGAILPPFLAVALPSLGWRNVFLLLAATLVFVCAPLCLILLRDRPRPGEGVGTEFADGGAPTVNVVRRAVKIGEIVGRRTFWLLAGCKITAGFISAGFLVNIGAMALHRDLTPGQAASLLSIYSLVALATKLVAGYGVDRLGARVVMTAILAMGALGVLAIAALPGFGGLLAATLLIGGCGSVVVPIASTASREFGPAVVGRVMGFLAFLNVVGGLAPPVVAFLRERSGGYTAPMMTLLAFGLLGTVLALMLRPRPVLTAELAI